MISVALLFYRHMPGRVVAMWGARYEYWLHDHAGLGATPSSSCAMCYAGLDAIVWLRNKLGSGGMITQALKLHHRGSYHSVSHVFGDSGVSSILVSQKFS